VTAAPMTHRRVVAAALVGSLAGVLGYTAWRLPREHAGLPGVAHQALTLAVPAWHTLEPVNEVVYGSRGFDTFGETFILLAAVLGVGLVSRAREPRRGFMGERSAAARERPAAPAGAGDGAEEQAALAAEAEEQGRRRGPLTPDSEPLGERRAERAEGMTVVVRGGVRVLAPVLAVAGVYLAAWGYSPGGGFPAGGVLFGVVLLAYAALGYRRISGVVRPDTVETLEMAGAALIIATEAGGLVWRGSFSANFLPLSQVGTIPGGGVLQVFSGGELIEVATGLTLATFGLLGMLHDWAAGDDAEGGGDRSGRRGRSAS
jgi:multicomponent Na+:H+ antiporter subunit B